MENKNTPVNIPYPLPNSIDDPNNKLVIDPSINVKQIQKPTTKQILHLSSKNLANDLKNIKVNDPLLNNNEFPNLVSEDSIAS